MQNITNLGVLNSFAHSNGAPTYNSCVVVDDWDMQISHLIRGDDHWHSLAVQF